jgi:transcriptional regulator with XRE-family HTH domain
MDVREIFAANLRRHRTAAGLSQEALGAKIGADRAHISSMERGRQNVTLITLWHLSEALGIETWELLKP